MDFFGFGENEKLSPECPKCKNTITFQIAEGNNWTEWRCSKCNRVFAIKPDEIKIMGEWPNGK